MGLKLNFFDFLHRKVDTANLDIEAIRGRLYEEISFRELAFFIAKSYIANTLSKCEIKTYEAGKEVHGELYYRLNVNPNPNQSGSQFINQIVEQYYSLDGGALVVPFKDGRMYCADGFQFEERPFGSDIFQNIQIRNTQLRTYRFADQVFYFKLDNANVRELLNCLYVQYGQLLGCAIDEYERSNSRRYKLKLDRVKSGTGEFNQKLDDISKQNIKEFLEKPNGVLPEYRGMSLEEFAAKTGTNSADIISLRKEIFDTTAQAMKIPLSMMYGNITNMQEIVKVYLSFCIDPLADMMSEELTRKTTDYFTWKSGNRVEVDTSCINHIDIFEIADKADKLISSGIMDIDEVRARLRLDTLDTEFSKQHWITKNNAKIEDLLEGGEI